MTITVKMQETGPTVYITVKKKMKFNFRSVPSSDPKELVDVAISHTTNISYDDKIAEQMS